MNFAAVVQLFQSGRPAEAEAGCRKILAANPRHADANHLLGILLLQSNRVADASKHLAESVAVRPSDPGAQMALGASLAMQNRIGEALPCFEAAVRLQPVNPDAQYNLALALAKLGRTEEALKGFAKTFAINPRHTGALIGEGVALAELGRYTQAADRFAQADKMAPGQPEILENLCQTLIDAGLIEEAEKALARIPPSQVENRPRSLFLKALLARHRKETDTAVLLFQQLLTKFPDLVEARLNLCSILTEERRFDEADRLIETAASQAPNHPLLPSTRGYLRMKQERYPEAEIDFAKAVEASPGRVHVWKAWQESRLRQGRFTDEVGLHRERPADAPHEAALDKPIQQLGDRIEQIVRPHAADGPTAVFFNPLAIRIGEFCGDFLYLRSVARSLYKKIVVLVPPDPQWINPEALRIVSQGVQVLPLPDQNIHEIAGQYDFGFLRREGIDIGLFSTRYLRRLYFHHRFKGGAMDRFELGTGDLERGREIEKKLGIPQGTPIVLLHARHGKTFETLSHNSFRDMNVLNYEKAVEWLVGEGYAVVRLGDRTMTPLNLKGPGIFDAPFHPGYEPFWDVYFSGICAFMISCHSGPCMLPRGFGRPLLAVNAMLHFSHVPGAMEVCAYKHHVRIQDGKRLDYQAILEAGVPDFAAAAGYEKAGIDLLELSPDELLEATREMVDLVRSGADPDNEANREYRRLNLLEHQKRIGDPAYFADVADYFGSAVPTTHISKVFWN